MSDKTKTISLDDVFKIVDDNLLPSGSRIIDTTGKKDKQVYPKSKRVKKSKRIIKGNIAEELDYDISDDEEEKEETT